MSANSRSTWATTDKSRSSAVPVRCPDCGWRTSRKSYAGNAGCCNRCFVLRGNVVRMVPVPRLAEARDTRAKEETKNFTRWGTRGSSPSSRTVGAERGKV